MQKTNEDNEIKRFFHYLYPYKKTLYVIFVLVFLYVILKLLGPYLMGIAIDKYIFTKDIKGLVTLLIILSVIYLGTSLSSWLQNYLMIGIAQKSIQSLREDLFAKLQTLSLNFFDSTPHGEIMSRFSNDIENVSITLNQSLIELVSNFISLLGILIFMIFLNWRLALVTILSTPIVLIISKTISSKTRKQFMEQQIKLGNLNGFIEEYIWGQKVIKAYNIQDEISDKFTTVNESLKDISIKAQIFSGIIGPIMNGFNNINLAIIAGFGGFLTIKNLATIGTIVTFINFARQFYQPLNQLANLYNQIQLAITGLKRVFEIIDEVPQVIDVPNAKNLESIRGNVNFKNVDFSYNKKDIVLKNINIQTNPGEIIALIGPTGSGKSTIMNLLTRFYDINKGEILLDNINIKDIKLKSLREKIGIVLQDTVLFSGTIKDNIKYGNLDTSDEDIIEAAKFSGIHEYIENLPDKYNTLISKDASEFSEGQKQLLSITRTILSNPQILVLDEATSNIDTITEQKIQLAMNKLMKGRTSFVIAHRLKTIINANKILVLRNGEIIECGNHSELMDKKGFYYDLYTTQFNIS